MKKSHFCATVSTTFFGLRNISGRIKRWPCSVKALYIGFLRRRGGYGFAIFQLYVPSLDVKMKNRRSFRISFKHPSIENAAAAIVSKKRISTSKDLAYLSPPPHPRPFPSAHAECVWTVQCARCLVIISIIIRSVRRVELIDLE